jgi:hypothetical protein
VSTKEIFVDITQVESIRDLAAKGDHPWAPTGQNDLNARATEVERCRFERKYLAIEIHSIPSEQVP